MRRWELVVGFHPRMWGLGALVKLVSTAWFVAESALPVDWACAGRVSDFKRLWFEPVCFHGVFIWADFVLPHAH